MQFLSVLAAYLLLALSTISAIAQPQRKGNSSSVPTNILLQIIRAEDERRWDNTLPVFLLDKNPNVRKRAALAMGRIGNTEALPALLEVLKTDRDNDVRQMTVFAVGEIEWPEGATALIDIVDDTRAPSSVRARAVEALGKIGAALLSDAAAASGSPDKRVTKIRLAILDCLRFETGRRSAPDRLSILLGLTAALRTKPEGAGTIIARFLRYADPRIVADALNALARLRLKDGNDEARELLVKGTDPIVRANAARVLGVTEDKQAFDALLDRALHDNDLRVRVSAIRALGSLKDRGAAPGLLLRGTSLSMQAIAKNELLEIVSALGRIAERSNDTKIIEWLRQIRNNERWMSVEVEVAFARVAPTSYLRETPFPEILGEIESRQMIMENWRQVASLASGVSEVATVTQNENKNNEIRKRAEEVADRLGCFEVAPCNTMTRALPHALRAYAAFGPPSLPEVLRDQFEFSVSSFKKKPIGVAIPSKDLRGDYEVPEDVILRATAAELISEVPPDKENARALIKALPVAFQDEMNDAALAILEALAKQKANEANQAIKTALNSSDHLIRRKAVALLKANGVGDFSNRIGTVKTRNTEADYRRAIARIGKHITATVETSKGPFVIEFLPQDATLTVDNFIQLAKKGFFNGQTIPRVVPNFVIQAGDPRGDTNGGPGYQIRCEINEVPYGRGAVGMALSGKDTGGSQWFVTHSPQPHLDGGYTVFGHVIRGMEVVDNIARGDVIRRVTINER